MARSWQSRSTARRVSFRSRSISGSPAFTVGAGTLAHAQHARIHGRGDHLLDLGHHEPRRRDRGVHRTDVDSRDPNAGTLDRRADQHTGGGHDREHAREHRKRQHHAAALPRPDRGGIDGAVHGDATSFASGRPGSSGADSGAEYATGRPATRAVPDGRLSGNGQWEPAAPRRRRTASDRRRAEVVGYHPPWVALNASGSSGRIGGRWTVTSRRDWSPAAASRATPTGAAAAR